MIETMRAFSPALQTSGQRTRSAQARPPQTVRSSGDALRSSSRLHSIRDQSHVQSRNIEPHYERLVPVYNRYLDQHGSEISAFLHDDVPHRANADAKFIGAVMLGFLQQRGLWQNTTQLHDELRSEGIVAQTIFPPALQKLAFAPAFDVLRAIGHDRTENNRFTGTARNHRSLGQPELKQHVPALNALVNSPIFLLFAARVFNRPLAPLPKKFRIDSYVAHEKSGLGQTLGPHLDLAPSAVHAQQSPPAGTGGEIRFMVPPKSELEPGTGLVDPTKVAAIWKRHSHLIQQRSIPTGQTYFLDTPYHIHEVAPLTRELAPHEKRQNVTISLDDGLRPAAYRDAVAKIELFAAFPEHAQI